MAWVVIDNIRGAKGAAGDKGDKGDRGDKGADGARGDRGPQGVPGTLSSASAESVPADAPAEVIMTGTVEVKHAHFKIPRGLPTPIAIENDATVAAYVAAPDSATGTALRTGFVGQEATGVVVPTGATIAEIQSAFDAAEAFGTRVVAAGEITTDTPLQVKTSCDLSGLTITHTGASSPAIVVPNSNVVIDGVTLIGPGNTTLSNSRGIQAIGVVGAPLREITIRNAKISGFRQVGIWLQHVDGFTVENCEISDCQYAGVHCMSVFHGMVKGNRISHITGTPLAYGITINKASEPLATAPRSTDVTITGNVITDVPNWEGIDTHGGERINITSNTVAGCKIGIAVVPAKDAPAVDEIFAPLAVTVVGNTVDSLKTDGTAEFGISFTGAYKGPLGTVYEYATGVISGNVVKNHGVATADNRGAMYIHTTRGVVVSGNQLINPSSLGINVHHDNQDITVMGNTITEVWATTSARCAAIMVREQYNTATIAGNRLAVNGEHSGATLVNTKGLAITTSSNNEIVAYGNQFSRAVTIPIDGAAALRSQFLAGTPAAIGSALSAANMATIDDVWGADERDVLNNVRARVNGMATLLQSLGLLT